jgi:Zn-finger nucleic acid-binding protein
MICPNCRNQTIVVEFRKIELDFCTNCEGVWFDGGELELLIEIAKLDRPYNMMQEILDSPEVSMLHKERKCPICGRGMAERGFGKPSVNIDICRFGDGIFFDGGELQEVLNRLAQQCKKGEDARQETLCFLGDVFKIKGENKEKEAK